MGCEIDHTLQLEVRLRRSGTIPPLPQVFTESMGAIYLLKTSNRIAALLLRFEPEIC
jgi:hypothetical protein